MRRSLSNAAARVALHVIALAALGILPGCTKPPIAKIEALRDALAGGDAARIEAALEELPPCNGAIPVGKGAGCLGDLARAFGSKTGFHGDPPDQASAAAAAVILTREKHGEWLPSPDAWLASMRTGGGPGADALRLATAARMSDAATRLGHAFEDEPSARSLLADVSGAIPGACATYALLADGADPAKLAPELTADHSPCVQRDLGRTGGPGGAYGYGTWRAAEGALAAWKDAALALHDGAAKMDGVRRAALDARLAPIDAASARVVLKKLPAPPDNSQYMSDVHADRTPLDAGAPPFERGLARSADGGRGPR